MFSKLVVAMEMVSHARTPLASMQSKQKNNVSRTSDAAKANLH